MPDIVRNVFGQPLVPCSFDPLTGFFRDGCCKTNQEDIGLHLVCAIMSEEFLEFSYQRGNDLITPRPEFQFPGLELVINGAYVSPVGKKHLPTAVRLL